MKELKEILASILIGVALMAMFLFAIDAQAHKPKPQCSDKAYYLYRFCNLSQVQADRRDMLSGKRHFSPEMREGLFEEKGKCETLVKVFPETVEACFKRHQVRNVKY